MAPTYLGMNSIWACFCIQAFVNEIETMDSSLKGMREIEANLRSCPVAGIKTWMQTKLVDYQTQVEKLSKEVGFSGLLSVAFKRQTVPFFQCLN